MKGCGNMKPEVVNRVINEFASISMQSGVSLAPVGVGEPLLYSRLFDVIQLFRREMPPVLIYIVTNGVLMNRLNCERIVDSGLDSPRQSQYA